MKHVNSPTQSPRSHGSDAAMPRRVPVISAAPSREPVYDIWVGVCNGDNDPSSKSFSSENDTTLSSDQTGQYSPVSIQFNEKLSRIETGFSQKAAPLQVFADCVPVGSQFVRDLLRVHAGSIEGFDLLLFSKETANSDCRPEGYPPTQQIPANSRRVGCDQSRQRIERVSLLVSEDNLVSLIEKSFPTFTHGIIVSQTWWPRTVYRMEYVETQCKKAAGRLLDGRTWDEGPALKGLDALKQAMRFQNQMEGLK
jgi:hypothetical protein